MGISTIQTPEANCNQELQRNSILDSHVFNSDKGLLGILKNQFKNKGSAIIDLDKKQRGIFYLNAKKNILYIRTSKNNIKIICQHSLNVTYRELEEYSFDEKQLTNISAKVPLDRFIWLISLITSKGRLPHYIDINNSQLSLKHWPNLSRYKNIPNMIRIASFFSQSPTTIAMATKMLACKMEHINYFVSACDALDLLQIDDSNSKFISNIKAISESKRGILSGILHRLMGQ
jgi:hypothetical protein